VALAPPQTKAVNTAGVVISRFESISDLAAETDTTVNLIGLPSGQIVADRLVLRISELPTPWCLVWVSTDPAASKSDFRSSPESGLATST